MTATDIRKAYLDFFKARGHVIVPSSPLIPENDPTTLFTGSGMQPMLPYLLGEKHPLGDRIVDSQKCYRTVDIDEVGNNRHCTFFEMLGNWSLGSYWKEEQLSWLFEFLTGEVKLDPRRLYVTVFSGDENNNIPRDTEAPKIWEELFSSAGVEPTIVDIGSEANGYEVGMGNGRIFYYDAQKNWWSRAGVPDNMPIGEPGGPDSEVFYLYEEIEHDVKFGKNCHPNCDCGRFVEIANSVFMTYRKIGEKKFEELKQRNIDFGGGFERIVAAHERTDDVFSTSLFEPLMKAVTSITGKVYEGDTMRSMRIVVDHVRAAVLAISEGIEPGNKQQNYIIRRLLRRAAVNLKDLKGDLVDDISDLVSAVVEVYENVYLSEKESGKISAIVNGELGKFNKTLKNGLRVLDLVTDSKANENLVFDLFQSYGFPYELSQELLEEKGIKLDRVKFDDLFSKHRDVSRTASAGMFKGGLADKSEDTVKLHTTTHLLHKALQVVLGDHVRQEGSNITGERLRFDFRHSEKITDEQIKEIENLMNEKIKEDLPVVKTIEDRDVALTTGAMANFRETYPEKVSVYTIGRVPNKGWFSKEFCGGPHVKSTGVIGGVTIKKVESIGSQTRRIYAVLDTGKSKQ